MRTIETLVIGETVRHVFTVTNEDMELFRKKSGDDSLIHVDVGFCQKHGFNAPIVYGGIMFIHLSTILGTMLPGKNGISASWSINYKKPLYVGEEAEFIVTVSHVSESTKTVMLKFQITRGDDVIATGKTESLILE